MHASYADHADAHSPAQHDRRSLLTAAAASLLIAQPAAAKDATADAPAMKELNGKAGFRFQYPDGWVTGFVSTLFSHALPCMSAVSAVNAVMNAASQRHAVTNRTTQVY